MEDVNVLCEHNQSDRMFESIFILMLILCCSPVLLSHFLTLCIMLLILLFLWSFIFQSHASLPAFWLLHSFSSLSLCVNLSLSHSLSLSLCLSFISGSHSACHSNIPAGWKPRPCSPRSTIPTANSRRRNVIG